MSATTATMSAEASMRDAIDALRSARTIAVVSHRDPDGDTIGAAVTLGLALESAGKLVSFHCADPVPDAFRFLPTTARFRREPPASADLVVTVDFGDAGRAKFELPPAIRLLNIDHHATNAGFGVFNVVDVNSPATAEVVSRLIDAGGWPWTPEMATAALLGIMTDTGSFQFPSTNPRCLERAARLLEAGADLAAIVTNALRTRPFEALKLFGIAFARLERELDGRLVYTWIDEADRMTVGARPEDASGLVEQIARSKGMRVAVLFNEEIPGAVKISIRTSAEPPAVDASRLAARFGGGGHVRAAGALVNGDLDPVKTEVLSAARAALA
jgi:phosphoesterase RecJ-like protein